MAPYRVLIVSAMTCLSVSACSLGHYDDKIHGSYESSLNSGFRALKVEDYQTAVSNIAFAAKSGHPKALVAYGDLYAKGKGVDFDPVRARDLYAEAYGKNSSSKGKAASSLGHLLLEGGEGPSGNLEADQTQARQFLIEALKSGETRAATTLGEIYAEGIGVEPNVNAAIEYYSVVAGENRKVAKERAILMVENDVPGSDAAVADVIAQYESYAQEGNEKAWLDLADFFTRDEITEPDLNRAYGYLQNVSVEGNSGALLRLATIQEKRGDKQNSKGLYKQAADLGDAKAQAKMAAIMLKGGTEDTNGPLGRRYADAAIAQDNKSAMAALGNALLKGEVLLPDSQLGETLLRTGSDAEHKSSMTALGSWLLRGKITPRFPNEGKQLLETAAASGSRGAMSALGFAYHSGKGLPKDENAAVLWLQRAADAGHTKSQQLLAKLQQPPGQ